MAGNLETLFNIVDTSIDGLVSSMITYSSSLKVIAGTAWLLFCVFQAIRMVSNEYHYVVYKELLSNFIRMTIVCTIVFNSSYYASNIVPIIRDSGADISDMLTGSSSNNLNQSLDGLLQYMINIFYQESDSWGITHLGSTVSSMIYCLFILTSLIIFLITGAVLLFTVKIALGLLSIVGLLFILFVLFPPTRSWFSLWVSQIASFTLLSAMFNILVNFALNIIDVFRNSDTTSLVGALGMFITVLSITAIIKELPNFTSSLFGASSMGSAGGGMSSLSGAMRSAGTLNRNTKGLQSLAKLGPKGVGKLSANLGKSAISKFTNKLGG